MLENLREELFNTLKSNPEDFETWGVYGDILLEQGDSRGEAISIDLALRDETDEVKKEEINKHRERLSETKMEPKYSQTQSHLVISKSSV